VSAVIGALATLARASHGVAELDDRVRDGWREQVATARAEHDRLRARIDELEKLINTPHTGEFFESVRLEAAHQIARWGAAHDGGKTPADWFWLLGHLAGKALHFPDKRLHHLASAAAALLNWYRAETGDSTAMRPGIAPPPECTGITAAWCPVHGDCSCPTNSEDRADDRCPLHAPTSAHGEGA
jgi:hypothetical protein